MSLLRSITWILGLLVSVACRQESRQLSDDTRANVAQEVEQLFDNYFAAVRRGGLTAEFDYLDNSGDFFWVPPGYSQSISYDSVVAVLTLNAGKFQLIENVMDSLHIVPLTASLASYSAKMRSTMKDTTGQTTTLRLVESGIVIRRNDKWKLLSGQTSLINP